MYKKIISVMSVALVVFLCSFPAFAVTGGGKTIVSNSYSYNNGDVTVYVRVNGNAAEDLYEGQHYYPHNFTVTLANNTNKFQVADASNFSIDLYSGSATAFASNQNSWGAEVISYSDNMTVPRITMYPSGDLAGHVLVAFNDSDLLVLNPNETRTYNFSINFIQTENINYTPLNGNYRYSYFTYTGTVGFYARPTSFSSNTIEDFINNDSLPNSAIAYYQYLLQQGIEDQDFYNQIIDLLMYSQLPELSFTNNGASLVVDTQLFTSAVNGLTFNVRRNILASYIVDRNVISFPSLDNSIEDFQVWATPVQYIVTFQAPDNAYKYSYWYIKSQFNFPFSNMNNVIGADYRYDSDYYLFIPTNYINGELHAYNENNQMIIPKGYSSIIVTITYYSQADGTTIYRPTPSTFSPSFNNGAHTASTFERYRDNVFSQSSISFREIINRLQSILDSYTANQSGADDLNDNSESVSDTVDNQHQTEANYFEDSQTAINDTGIQNFQFDSNTLGGLGGIKDDFTAVWTSCGTLSQYWIASLTIGLALSIIRHRRMFEK